MPANPNLLPKPCPKCDSDFGTVVIIDTHRGLKIRIGHYAKNARKKVVKEGLTPLEKNEDVKYTDKIHKLVLGDDALKTNTEKLKTKIKNSERKWCTFNPTDFGIY